jgi:hypothetical protein
LSCSARGSLRAWSGRALAQGDSAGRWGGARRGRFQAGREMGSDRLASLSLASYASGAALAWLQQEMRSDRARLATCLSSTPS